MVTRSEPEPEQSKPGDYVNTHFLIMFHFIPLVPVSSLQHCATTTFSHPLPQVPLISNHPAIHTEAPTLYFGVSDEMEQI